jgi:hypothetical protein
MQARAQEKRLARLSADTAEQEALFNAENFIDPAAKAVSARLVDKRRPELRSEVSETAVVMMSNIAKESDDRGQCLKNQN